MGFKHKAKKTSPQITIPENLDNNRTLRETCIDLIYMGSKKGKVLLSKLGAWGSCVGGEKEGSRAEKNI